MRIMRSYLESLRAMASGTSFGLLQFCGCHISALSIDSYISEAALLQKCRHPAVAELEAIFESDEAFYLQSTASGRTVDHETGR